MRNLELFVRVLPSLACVVGAVVTAIFGVEWWCVFLLAAVYLCAIGRV